MAAMVTYFKTATIIIFVFILTTEARSLNQIMTGDTSTLYTSSDYNYTNFWMEMLERDNLVFSIKACSDVHILLSQIARNLTGQLTEVVLGGWHNSRSVIRRGLQGEHYADVQTPEVLHCSEFRTFWVSWGLFVRFGKGPIPGEQIIIAAPGTIGVAKVIRAVAFSTGFGHSGVWKIKENQGYVIAALTPDNFRYQYMWKSVIHKNKYISFFFMGCHDAHINLTPTMGTTHYEVVIGGWENKRSVIRVGGGEKSVSDMEGLVECLRPNRFWIGWDHGNLKVGKGDIFGEGQFLEWQDPSPLTVNYIAVSAGFGSVGIWSFNDDLENHYRYFATSENKTFPSFDVFSMTPSQYWTTFIAQACSDVMVALSPMPADLTDLALFISIGNRGNTRSSIYSGFSPTPVVDVNTPQILSCDHYNTFWVSWRHRKLEVGRGNVEGFLAFLSYDIPPTLPYVNSIGFGNNHNKGAYLRLNKNSGDAQVITVRKNYDINNAWLTVVEDFYVTFAVRACRDVRIAMSAVEGILVNETYELTIGLNGYKTAIAEKIGHSEYLASNETPEVLSCREYRYFWLSWLDGFIRIGKGEKWGKQQLLSLPQVKPHPVNALSLSTDSDQAVFEFESDRGDYSVLKVPSDDISMKWFSISEYSRLTWFYFGVNDGPVRIVLSDRYRDAYHAYHVYLGLNKNTVHKLFRDTTEVASVVQPDVIKITERTHIWISWEGGLIRVGKSKYRGVLPLLEYKDNSPYTVRALALTGIEGNVPEVRIWNKHIHEISYDTGSSRSFDQFQMSVRHQTDISFSLNTCSSAQVALCSYMYSNGQRFCYTVLIGRLNITSIFRVHHQNQHEMIRVPTPDILKCREERRFWLSWYGGHIAFGTGELLGSNGVVAYQDLNAYPIASLSITTDGQPGIWRFSRSRSLSEIPPEADRRLNGGQIAGIIIGGLVLLMIFIAVVDAVTKPPRALEKYLTDPAQRTGKVPQSFVNPLAGSYDDS